MNPENVAELIQYRMDQAREALDDARFLLSGGRGIGGVVNRAYYGMFYAALALMQTRGTIPTKHTGVIGIFDVEFVQQGHFSKSHSEWFHRAFDLRQSADYRIRKIPSIEETQELLDRADAFISAVGDFLFRSGYLK